MEHTVALWKGVFGLEWLDFFAFTFSILLLMAVPVALITLIFVYFVNRSERKYQTFGKKK